MALVAERRAERRGERGVKLRAERTVCEPAVAVRELVQRLGNNEVLRGVSFELPAGEVLAVMGPNGAGKTTLLRVLGTLLRPTGGQVLLAGQDVLENGPELRRSIGFLGHHTFLYPQLTAWENLWFWARAFGVPDPEARVKDMLGAVGLGLFAHDQVRHYSRGMQQRLALARVLLHDPELLLLDEPYAGLDQEAAHLLDGIIHRWREHGRAVVMTGHDPVKALAVSDRILVLHRGRVIRLGTSRDLGTSGGPGSVRDPRIGHDPGTGGGPGEDACQPGEPLAEGSSGRVRWREQVGALVWKELRAEVRTRETLAPMVLFALTVVTVFGFGLRATGTNLEPVFPGLLWTAFYFVGLLGLGRSFSGERAQDTLAGLLLVPADRSFIFVGKLLANLAFLVMVEIISLPLFFGLLGMPFRAALLPFCATLILGTLGFASLGTLLAALAAHSRASEMLLPVLLFPVLIPAVIGAVGAMASLFGVADPTGWRRWLGMLLAYDILFVALPLVLFDYLVEP